MNDQTLKLPIFTEESDDPFEQLGLSPLLPK
jgi:hypothetical protein